MSLTEFDEDHAPPNALHRLVELYEHKGNGVDAWAAIRHALLTQQPLPESLIDYLLGIAEWALIESGRRQPPWKEKRPADPELGLLRIMGMRPRNRSATRLDQGRRRRQNIRAEISALIASGLPQREARKKVREKYNPAPNFNQVRKIHTSTD